MLFQPVVCFFNWHIVPLVNPDGYEFSRLDGNQCPDEVESNRWKGCRYWRKNRRMGVCPSIPAYEGIDLNRNFGSFWKEDDECSDTFGGDNSFSEPETEAVRKYIQNNILSGGRRRRQIDPKTEEQQFAAIDLHSYSRVILIPEDMNVPNTERVKRIGNAMADSINGANYPVDSVSQFYDLNSCRKLGNHFRANGTAMDWFHHGAGKGLFSQVPLS